MNEIPNKNLMPRREFIRKSVQASGVGFVGMTVGGKVPLPQLTKGFMPSQSASLQGGNNNGNNGNNNGNNGNNNGNNP